jgi:23S rRNA (uracil1939-C5)-methyltransferase
VILTVARLGHRGDGVAEGPIFVPGTLPGEVVEGEVSGARMAAPRILTPSSDRVRPPCPHARACGGCTLQHASDGFVARWKVDVVRIALAAQGLEAPFRMPVTSPSRSRRRATLAGRRTKSGVTLGFHARAADTVIAVPECHLLHPDLMAAFPALQAITAAGASRKGELTLTVTRSEAGADVAVTGGKPADATLRLTLAQLVEQHRLARLSWDEEVIALRSPSGASLRPGPSDSAAGGFPAGNCRGRRCPIGRSDRGSRTRAAYRRPVRRLRHLRPATRQAGRGSCGRGRRRNAGGAARRLAPDPGLRRVTTEARDLFRRPLVPEELTRFDAVVIDPPRAGAEAQARALAEAAWR